MTTAMSVLTTERLAIRPFQMEDLERVYQIMDVDFTDETLVGDAAERRAERKRWLAWSIANHEQLGKLYQPPYGEKALVLRVSNEVIGACGLVPCLGPFSQLPSFSPGLPKETRFAAAEVGLFYAVARDHRGRGYATEAARALIEYAFRELRLGRIIAMTSDDNERSIAVMRRLRMSIDRNPFPDPAWLQVVGVLQNDQGAQGHAHIGP
jgi:[ribosomal protein S5]-alanine N-acetyltransferase